MSEGVCVQVFSGSDSLLYSVSQFTLLGTDPYHKLCYKELHHPKCDVCLQFVRFFFFVDELFAEVLELIFGLACRWNSICRKPFLRVWFLLQIPTNRTGLIEYRAHPFWGQKYCPLHEHDRTPRCCSCEKMEVCTAFLAYDECISCLQIHIKNIISFSIFSAKFL